MTIAFAETVSDKYNNNDITYHVEWLDSEEAFPTLGSETMNHHKPTTSTFNSLQDWQILKKQDIYNDEQDILAIDGRKITVSEMEDKWEEIQYEKQYVDVAEKAASLPLTNNAPIKPLRHQPKNAMTKEKEERELRLLYWDHLDQLILEENNDDLYYHRKTQSTRGNKGSLIHLRRRLEFLSLSHKSLQHLSFFGNRKVEQFLDTIPSLHGSTWGAPHLNRRLLHGLTHLYTPSYLNYQQERHSHKNPKFRNEDDIILT
ncbi:unnamed protein product [Cunninghamella blakesleeana]